MGAGQPGSFGLSVQIAGDIKEPERDCVSGFSLWSHCVLVVPDFPNVGYGEAGAQ